MAYRSLAKNNDRLRGPTAPRKRYITNESPQFLSDSTFKDSYSDIHPLCDPVKNMSLGNMRTMLKVDLIELFLF